MTTKLYLWSKQIHRLCMYGTIFMVLIKGGTGLILKYDDFFRQVKMIDLIYMRELHNTLSIYFAIFLACMMLTGLYMYLYPFLRSRKPPQPPAVL
jgi:hypothetical protein